MKNLINKLLDIFFPKCTKRKRGKIAKINTRVFVIWYLLHRQKEPRIKKWDRER